MSTGRWLLLDAPDDDLPEPQQVGQVAGEFAFGAVAAGGADDEAHALGRVEFEHDVAQRRRSSSSSIFRETPTRPKAGHQHQVAAGDADVGRERRALGADAFLDDLHEHFVAAAEDFLDGRLESRPAAEAVGGVDGHAGRLRRFVVDFVARRRRRRRFGGAVRADCRRANRLVGIVAALAEVLRLDVADVQEAVAADAEIDERRLDARLQVDHDALVDVAYVIVLSGAVRRTALRGLRPQRSRSGILPAARR